MNKYSEERESLKEVYDTIADSWSNLKQKPREYLVNAKLTGPLLDVGCGNSRNLIPFLKKKMRCIGIDFSKSMIKQSKTMLDRNNLSAGLVIADACNLPFKKSSFNSIISNATLHNIPSREMRILAMREIKRVGKKGSRIILTLWYRWQLFHLKNIVRSLFRLNFGNVYVRWNYHGKKLERFYHLYTKHELEEDIENAGLKVIKISLVNENNKKNLLVECMV